MGFFRDNEVLGDVGAGEPLEELTEFCRFHGVPFAIIPPSSYTLSYLNSSFGLHFCCTLTLKKNFFFKFFLKVLPTGHFDFIIKNVDPT